MDNSTFTAKIEALDTICNGALELARKHTADRRTETVGGWWRPFEYPRDLACFHELLEGGFSRAHRIEAYFRFFPGAKMGFTLSSYLRGEKEAHDRFDFQLG